MGGVVEEEECFKKGAIVEVCLEDEGFRGSWYTATVLSNKKNNHKNKKKKILVEFHTLMADDKATKPLRESVDIVLVRPVPPRETKRSFLLSEEVDAFHNDGWWEGIVTDVIYTQDCADDAAGGLTAKYSVFFRSSREQIVFQESDLRLHREWVYGKWVPPLLPPDEDHQQQQPPPPMC